MKWAASLLGPVAITLLAGCAAGPEQALPEGMLHCSVPRPEVCTMVYNPVCAVLGSGERKQYASGCSACSDKAVIGHVAGPCQ